MSKIIVEKASYDYASLKPVIYAIMDNLGGDEIKACKRVLIKPNLLAAAKPDEAVVTHYMIVKAVAEYVLDKGAVPIVSDSPGIGSFDKIIKYSGIRDALAGLNVECREFRESMSVDIGAPFGFIDLARDAVEAEMIINLPKLKTHAQMILTLGVKNMFGCVVGLRKPEWHMRMGLNKAMFANLLVRIYERLKPSFTILDGILAMEGDGPRSGGIPRRLDVIMASRDAFSVDAAVCRMLGLEAEKTPILKAAKELGFFDRALEIAGGLPDVRDYKFPNMAPLAFGPEWMQGLLRRYLLQRPVCDQAACKMCGQCWEFCPASAIAHTSESLTFDYNRCIRCYCCIEACPCGALHSMEPAPGRILRKIAKVV